MNMRDIINLAEGKLPEGWDLGGAWIKDSGELVPVDHANDIHHGRIALAHYADFIEPNDEGEHDKYSEEAARDAAMENGWIRISTRGTRSISVEWDAMPSLVAQRALLSYLRGLQESYSHYEVESQGEFETFPDLRLMVACIRRRFGTKT